MAENMTEEVENAMMEKQLNPHQMAKTIKEKYGKNAIHERTVYKILNGKSPFPKGHCIAQIAEPLDVNMQEIIIKNPEANSVN